MFRFFAFFALLSFALHAQTFWQGESGGFHITWTAANLTAPPNFDAHTEAEKKWKNLKGDNISATFDYTLLSAVGPILSIQYGEECDCGGAHPIAFTGFTALDLAANKPASLLDYFPEAVLYSTLMNDSVVKAALADKKPASFSELSDALKTATYETNACSYWFGSDFLSHFAFYDYRPGFASVRISLSHAVETCRGSFTQLGLELPVSDRSLKTALAAAKPGHHHGILMHDLTSKVDPDTSTSFNFP